MLHIDGGDHGDSASSSSSTSCHPPDSCRSWVLVSSSSTRTTCGARRNTRFDVEFGELLAAILDELRRHRFDALDQVGGLLAAVGFRSPRRPRRPAPTGDAPRRASRRSFDTGRGPQIDAQLTTLLLGGGPVGQPTHHPPVTSRFCRILLVEIQVELQRVDRRLAEEPEEPAIRVCSHDLADLFEQAAPRALATRFTWSRRPHTRPRCGSRPLPLAVTASAWAPPPVRQQRCRGPARIRPGCRNPRRILGAPLDPHAFVGVEERCLCGVARLVDTDHPRRVDDVAARIARADHRQHRPDTAARAERAVHRRHRRVRRRRHCVHRPR